ncbi:MAG: hypothetical protein JNJ77_17330 [Planctomycetia bacterium]|nr:hypothetical protein [Planctomycetia bacterium]
MNELTITPLENRVLQEILRGDSEVNRQLRNQLEHATIRERELTGVGFFLNFDVPKHLSISDSLNRTIGNVHAEVTRLEHGMGFVLFITHGLIDVLEGFTYGYEEFDPACEIISLRDIQSKP